MLNEQVVEYAHSLAELLPPFVTKNPLMVDSYAGSALLMRDLAQNRFGSIQDRFWWGNYDPVKMTPEQRALWMVAENHGIEAVATLWSIRDLKTTPDAVKELVRSWLVNEGDIRAAIEENMPFDIQRADLWLQSLERNAEYDYMAQKIPQANTYLRQLIDTREKFTAHVSPSDVSPK